MDINQAWKETCKVLLGAQVGELEEFAPYLTKYVEPIFEKKSALSRQKVIVSRPDFASGSKFIANDEMEKYDASIRARSLDINKIKDIDSLMQAIGENFYYAGNQITGNSGEVSESDNIIDSQVVHRSAQVWGGKFIAYSSMSRFDEYIFGTNWSGQSRYCIRDYETYCQTRCMECLSVWTSSDCYFSAGLEGCANCFFSFNRKNSLNLIGNVQFSKTEYMERKNKLLADICSDLSRKKDFPALIEIMGGCAHA